MDVPRAHARKRWGNQKKESTNGQADPMLELWEERAPEKAEKAHVAQSEEDEPLLEQAQD